MWGFPKYPRVRKYVSPGSAPSVPVGEICLTGSNNAKKPWNLLLGNERRMDREKPLLHFQLGCSNFMASEFSSEKKKKRLWWQLPRPQSCSYLQCFPEQDGQWAKSWRLGSLRQIRTHFAERDVLPWAGKHHKIHWNVSAKRHQTPWIPSPLGECRVPGFKDMSSV